MKKQIVIIVLITFNLFILFFQLFDKSYSIKILNMEGEFYPFSLVADDEYIYFIGIEYDRNGQVQRSQIYQAKKGESTPWNVKINPPDNMLFYSIYVNSDQRLYAFLCDDQNRKCEIWELSQDKKIIKKTDITHVISQSEMYGISAFAVDNEGRYYLREYLGNETIVLGDNGIELCRIEDGNREFHCMGCAKNGTVYILFSVPQMRPTQIEIDRINIAQKDLDMESLGDFLPVDDMYSVLEAGEKYDFLIRGMKGAYQYNLGEDKSRKVINSFQIDQFEYNSSTSYFLNDNELLMIAKKQHIGDVTWQDDVKFCYYAY